MWWRPAQSIPTSINRYRTISSLLNSASDIPWRWSFSSIIEQIADRLVSLNWGICLFLLIIKSLWLGSTPISVPPLYLLLLLLEIQTPFAGTKYDFKPRHPVTADFFISDKPFLGWTRLMVLLVLGFISLFSVREKAIGGQYKQSFVRNFRSMSPNFTIQSKNGLSCRKYTERSYVISCLATWRRRLRASN